MVLCLRLKIDGSKTPFAMLNPGLVSTVKPNKTITMCLTSFSAYDSNYHPVCSDGVNNNYSRLWDAANNAVNLYCKDTATGSWSFDGTDMQFLLKSQNITA